MKTIEWRQESSGCAMILLDQTLLPTQVETLEARRIDQLVDAIQRLVVRGAPALGVVGALGVGLILDQASREAWDRERIEAEIDRLRNARPTAVNLAGGVDRVRPLVPVGLEAVVEVGLMMAQEDEANNREMGKRGADYLLATIADRPLTLLTHCNTGSLATTAWGTALGVVRELHARGKIKEVFADETRPLLQGARLTAWELQADGIGYRVLPDGAAASAILGGLIDAALIGADRIAKNGDSANKIGSLAVALACEAAAIPFLVVAPESSIDRATPNGDGIEIEFRSDEEVTTFAGKRTAPLGAKAYNPAFDVTPAKYITAIVTEKRVYHPEQGESL
jgi:methylthioribose-1-phosphate isomerase